jgi:uncharacterized protein with LGFP repeats
VNDPIRRRWLDAGGEREWLPLGDAVHADATVVIQHFVSSSSTTLSTIGGSDVAGVWMICGETRNKWHHTGGVHGRLGTPFGEERPCGTRAETLQRFRHLTEASGGGSIVHRPGEGTFEVHGEIERAWASAGWETGLGLPESDRLSSGDGRGTFTQFLGSGSVRSRIYEIRGIGTVIVRDPILATWYETGAEHGRFGYPISREEEVPAQGARWMRFEFGVLRVSSDGRVRADETSP